MRVAHAAGRRSATTSAGGDVTPGTRRGGTRPAVRREPRRESSRLRWLVGLRRRPALAVPSGPRRWVHADCGLTSTKMCHILLFGLPVPSSDRFVPISPFIGDNRTACGILPGQRGASTGSCALGKGPASMGPFGFIPAGRPPSTGRRSMLSAGRRTSRHVGSPNPHRP
jgi:hypothetical protein